MAREDAAAVFQLADRAVESGYDLRTVLRELGRLTRDLLVISIDPSRLADPEIAAEGEQEQLTAAAGLFSHEDLMRAFDLLTKGEDEIRSSMQPRFHLEMTLLRWIHLRKLVPLSELIEGLERGGTATPGRSQGSTRPPARPGAAAAAAARRSHDGGRPAARRLRGSAAAASAAPRPPDVRRPESPPKSGAGKQVETSGSLPAVDPVAPDRFKEAFLEEIQKVRRSSSTAR